MHIYLPFPLIFAPLLIIYHTFSVIFVCCPAEAPLFTAVQCLCVIRNSATAQLLKYPQHAFHFLNYAFLEAHQRNKTHLNVHCTLSFIATSRAHENGIFILHFRLCIIYFAEVFLRGGHHGR